MNKQVKNKTAFVIITFIAVISVFLNIYLVLTRAKYNKQGNEDLSLNNSESIVEEKKG